MHWFRIYENNANFCVLIASIRAEQTHSAYFSSPSMIIYDIGRSTRHKKKQNEIRFIVIYYKYKYTHTCLKILLIINKINSNTRKLHFWTNQLPLHSFTNNFSTECSISYFHSGNSLFEDTKWGYVHSLFHKKLVVSHYIPV